MSVARLANNGHKIIIIINIVQCILLLWNLKHLDFNCWTKFVANILLEIEHADTEIILNRSSKIKLVL